MNDDSARLGNSTYPAESSRNGAARQKDDSIDVATEDSPLAMDCQEDEDPDGMLRDVAYPHQSPLGVTNEPYSPWLGYVDGIILRIYIAMFILLCQITTVIIIFSVLRLDVVSWSQSQSLDAVEKKKLSLIGQWLLILFSTVRSTLLSNSAI